MLTLRDFEGKAVLVTGAGGGIGRAACLEFAQRGGDVLAVDISETHNDETISLIAAAGGSAVGMATDITATGAAEEVIRFGRHRYGKVDCAFNNAGIADIVGSFMGVSLENFRRFIEVNLTAVFAFMQAEIQEMLRIGGGSIVNVSSAAAFSPPPGLPHYAAAKSGVLALTKSGAIEFAKKNIRVNTIVPGSIDTPMIRATMGDDPDAVARISARWAMGRMGRPEEAASAAVWLCSDAASFVNGLSLIVDGGSLCI
jgi:NAD(P)-dependent dehydrogenase (short-subunit alcohol dehydrogenase family)